jgi:hypothetical protein
MLPRKTHFGYLDKYSQPTIIAVEQAPSGKVAINVYGQQIERGIILHIM